MVFFRYYLGNISKARKMVKKRLLVFSGITRGIP